eukprot:PhM_4_TR10195/c0_g2_i1/m.79749
MTDMTTLAVSKGKYKDTTLASRVLLSTAIIAAPFSERTWYKAWDLDGSVDAMTSNTGGNCTPPLLADSSVKRSGDGRVSNVPTVVAPSIFSTLFAFFDCISATTSLEAKARERAAFAPRSTRCSYTGATSASLSSAPPQSRPSTSSAAYPFASSALFTSTHPASMASSIERKFATAISGFVAVVAPMRPTKAVLRIRSTNLRPGSCVTTVASSAVVANLMFSITSSTEHVHALKRSRRDPSQFCTKRAESPTSPPASAATCVIPASSRLATSRCRPIRNRAPPRAMSSGCNRSVPSTWFLSTAMETSTEGNARPSGVTTSPSAILLFTMIRRSTEDVAETCTATSAMCVGVAMKKG